MGALTIASFLHDSTFAVRFSQLSASATRMSKKICTKRFLDLSTMWSLCDIWLTLGGPALLAGDIREEIVILQFLHQKVLHPSEIVLFLAVLMCISTIKSDGNISFLATEFTFLLIQLK